jgi:hypothetical protein
MILIAVGIFSGIKHGFRGGGWIVLLLVGGFFLLENKYPNMELQKYAVPFVIICVGLAMISRPHRWGRPDARWHRDAREWRRRRRHGRWDQWNTGQPYNDAGDPYKNPPNQQNYSSGPVPPPEQPTGTRSTEDYIDSVSVFGGVRKVIMSKNFRGGEATSFMGGTELDFSQADINGIVVLELTQVMGGAKLIVPGHWSIKNEVNAVLGGVDDKRQLNTIADPSKVLVLKGTSFLGGLEISNF